MPQSMDRSRRDMNPKYYNPNRTTKRGHRKWKTSRRYRRVKDGYQDICRKNAINWKLANRRIAHAPEEGQRVHHGTQQRTADDPVQPQEED